VHVGVVLVEGIGPVQDHGLDVGAHDGLPRLSSYGSKPHPDGAAGVGQPVRIRAARSYVRNVRSSARRDTPVLASSRSTCLSTVRTDKNSRAAICLLVRPSVTSVSTSASRSVTPSAARA